MKTREKKSSKLVRKTSKPPIMWKKKIITEGKGRDRETQIEGEGKGGNGIIERFLPFRALEGPPNSSVSPPNAIPSHYSTKAKSEKNVVERVA